jgi:GNAT superfamily N-acetyltransferase
MEFRKDNYIISTDRSKIDTRLVHDYLCHHSYWAKGIAEDIVKRSIENSLCWGIYLENKQVGFARVISDLATYAYLADVFIVPEEQGKGLAKWLIQVILDHPQLQGLRRFVLATKDAHGLYAQFGFTTYANPDRLMCRHDPDVYKSPQ